MGTVGSEKKTCWFWIMNKKHSWFELQEKNYYITFFCPRATALLLHCLSFASNKKWRALGVDDGHWHRRLQLVSLKMPQWFFPQFEQLSQSSLDLSSLLLCSNCNFTASSCSSCWIHAEGESLTHSHSHIHKNKPRIKVTGFAPLTLTHVFHRFFFFLNKVLRRCSSAGSFLHDPVWLLCPGLNLKPFPTGGSRWDINKTQEQ